MNNEPVELQLVPDSERLYVFFGGIAAGIVIPPFEFYNSAKILDHSKVFIRDFEQSWYQAGLPGIARDVNATTDYLRSLIDDLKPKRCFFVGNSMGGYAAILFHALLGTGEAIAFAPQTFITPFRRLWHRDIRWMRHIWNTYKRSPARQRVWDLKPVLSRMNLACNVSIFVSRDERLDRVHARHLKGVPGVRIFEHQAGGHEVVKLLRKSGELPAIMSGEYSPNGARRPAWPAEGACLLG